jgi:predicted membrane metal-binding protein
MDFIKNFLTIDVFHINLFSIMIGVLLGSISAYRRKGYLWVVAYMCCVALYFGILKEYLNL